jgi:hypothetical protein
VLKLEPVNPDRGGPTSALAGDGADRRRLGAGLGTGYPVTGTCLVADVLHTSVHDIDLGGTK